MNKLPHELVEMIGKNGIRRDSKKIKLTKRYKGQEVAKSHDRPRPEGHGT